MLPVTAPPSHLLGLVSRLRASLALLRRTSCHRPIGSERTLVALRFAYVGGRRSRTSFHSVPSARRRVHLVPSAPPQSVSGTRSRIRRFCVGGLCPSSLAPSDLRRSAQSACAQGSISSSTGRLGLRHSITDPQVRRRSYSSVSSRPYELARDLGRSSGSRASGCQRELRRPAGLFSPFVAGTSHGLGASRSRTVVPIPTSRHGRPSLTCFPPG